MAKKIAIRAFLFCVFALASTAAAQQPPDSHGEATGAPARAGVNGVGAPRCIYCPPPNYTKKARAAKLQGTVLLDVTVTEDGEVIDPKLIKGLGLGMDEKALTQVKKWKMQPAISPNGKPAKCRVQIEVTFHLY